MLSLTPIRLIRVIKYFNEIKIYSFILFKENNNNNKIISIIKLWITTTIINKKQKQINKN